MRLTMIALAALVAGPALLSSGCGKGGDKASVEEEKAPAADQAVVYHCPMHPTITSDKPGECPICGMNLVPMEDGGATDTTVSSSVPGLAVVSITPESRQTMGLQLGAVERRRLAREVRTSARIVSDETRLHHVTVKIDGWVNDLYASVTGQEVRQGDPLFTIYSPDLLSAQQEYLTALETRDKLAKSSDPAARHSAEDLVVSSRRRLELWDITGGQIDRIERTRQIEKYLTLYAHGGGFIVERNISAGHRVVAGEVLLTIADLSEVWGDADIYQSDLPYIAVGMPLEMSLPFLPDKTFRGKVIFISPTVDPETRTLKARLALPNPERLLKPGMYGDASLYYQLGEGLAIPVNAVMFSGRNTYAFKDTGDGHLVPTRIEVGSRGDGWYELRSGLEEGDRIVVSANFLVDSESSLKAALEAMSGAGAKQPAAGHEGHQQ